MVNDVVFSRIKNDDPQAVVYKILNSHELFRNQGRLTLPMLNKILIPNAPEATPVDLAFLQQMASEGRESLPVQVGNRIIDLIVKGVLSQIEKESKTPSPNIVVNVQGNMYGAIGNNNIVNLIQNEFRPIYEASSRDAT